MYFYVFNYFQLINLIIFFIVYYIIFNQEIRIVVIK